MHKSPDDLKRWLPRENSGIKKTNYNMKESFMMMLRKNDILILLHRLGNVWNNFNVFGTLGKELAKEIGDICVKFFIALPEIINRYPNICSDLSSMDLKERW